MYGLGHKPPGDSGVRAEGGEKWDLCFALFISPDTHSFVGVPRPIMGTLGLMLKKL